MINEYIESFKCMTKDEWVKAGKFLVLATLGSVVAANLIGATANFIATNKPKR